MLRLKSLTRALCLTLGMAASAGAMATTFTDASATGAFDLSGGTSINLLDAGSSFNPTWFRDAALYTSDFDLSTVWRGATLLLTQPAEVSFKVTGFDSAFNNAFVSGGQQLRNLDANGESMLGSNFSFSSTATGPLDFGFLTNGLGALFGNGSSNIGVMLSNDRQRALIVFDDRSSDGDFDDMMIRVSISPVPEPETLAMLLSGLGMVMLGVRRRARRETAAALA